MPDVRLPVYLLSILVSISSYFSDVLHPGVILITLREIATSSVLGSMRRSWSMNSSLENCGVAGGSLVILWYDRFQFSSESCTAKLTNVSSSLGQPFTNDFPRGDIYTTISPDILHQLIKGTFKDHLITWVEMYISNNGAFSKSEGKKLLAQIDRR